jgi:uncharacterized protein YoxC
MDFSKLEDSLQKDVNESYAKINQSIAVISEIRSEFRKIAEEYNKLIEQVVNETDLGHIKEMQVVTECREVVYIIRTHPGNVKKLDVVKNNENLPEGVFKVDFH